MFRIISILYFVLIVTTSLFGQDCYVVIEDRMGIVDTASLEPVKSAACAIREVLPDSIKESFVVIEEGHYFPSDYFDSSNDALELTRFNQLSTQHQSLLLISRQTNRLGETRFKVKLQLPKIEAYGCVNEGLTTILADQVAARMNESSADLYVYKEAEGLDLLERELDKAYNCCSLTESKATDLCSSCDYGSEPTLTNQLGFVELEQKIRSLTTGGQFLKLENLKDVVASRVQSPGDPIEVNISAKWKELPGGFSTETFPVQLTDDLKALRARGGNDVKVRAKLFDHTNCSELQSTLANWSRAGFDYETAIYGEELIVLAIGGQVGVYSRLRSPSPQIADYCEEDNINGLASIGTTRVARAKVILPVALVVREILKRALMGAVNVFIDVGLGVTVEKVFHQVSDECEVNTWGAAWNRYKLTVSGWQLFFTFVDGAIDKTALSIITAGLTDATAYLLDPTSGASFNKGSPEFNVGEFFDRFVKGCVKYAAAGQVLNIKKHASKAAKKLKSENLTPSQLSQYTAEVVRLTRFFLKERGRAVRAWRLADRHNLPISWRSDPFFLDKLRNIWDYQFANGKLASLPNVKLSSTQLTKLPKATVQQMRSTFNYTVKPDFLKSLGSQPNISSVLKKAGFPETDIPTLVRRLKSGSGIPGHQVHHKIPIDLGRSNEFSNLELMRNIPFHTAITSFQNRLNLSVGQSVTTDFPRVPGAFYSPPYIQ